MDLRTSTPKDRYNFLIKTSSSEQSVKLVNTPEPDEHEYLNAAVDLVVFELAEFRAGYEEHAWSSILSELRNPHESTHVGVSEFSKRHVERCRLAAFSPWVPRIVKPAQFVAQMHLKIRAGALTQQPCPTSRATGFLPRVGPSLS